MHKPIQKRVNKDIGYRLRSEGKLMNSELIYTIGVGNTRSYICVIVMQLTMYMLSIDMMDPAKGIFIATLISVVVSMIAVIFIQYYNSELALTSNSERHVRTIEDKKRVFRKVMLISYGVSIVLLTFFFLVKIIVAPYFIVTGPVSLIILLALMGIHDYSVNGRYKQLSNERWVFDYRRVPIIRTKSKLHNITINMFNNKNQFIANESIEATDIDELFKEMPPGTVMKGEVIKKPRFKSVDFKYHYDYTNASALKIVYLKKDTREEIKLFNLYLDVLSKYSGLYTIEDDVIKCCKMTMNLNMHKAEKYIDDNKYIKQYIASKDLEIAYIGIKLNPDLAKKSLNDFVKRIAKPVIDYSIRKEANAIYILEPSDNDKEKEVDVTYLQRYMSLSLDDYQCKHDSNTYHLNQNYSSLKERIEATKNFKRVESREEEVDGNKKTLYRINIKGELVYLFVEDFKTVSEVDEIIVTKFINRDIADLLKKVGHEG